ncbi:uncharacterized protein LOC115210688 isoform X2 [Octopus sinensis]|uniref:Uncharacterized protein LOC115210688 isoform X2 n=1 Tax=Octopus sinensis TaxID=2607531 RepID=A0A7E6ER39_9MOLL|nr:uncharacterized protein LOC115210688 isoform X2 [Octopus sinensis]
MDKVKHIFKMRKNTYEIHDWTKIDEKLLKAIQSNNIDRVEILLTRRAVITTKLGPNGYSCFHVACANGLSEIVKLLISCGADVNACNTRGYCGLHLASHNGFPDVASQLLKAGADIELKDNLEKTALHHACNTSCKDVVEVLIRNKANVNAFDQQKETPLFYSSYHGHLGICKLLVVNGAEINRRDKDKATPLFLATLQKHADVCEYLMQQGADPHSMTESGMSPYKCSQTSESTEIKNLFGKMVTQRKFNSTDSRDNATYETLTTSYESDMSLTSSTHPPSALRLNSSEGSQGSDLLDDITSSLQGPVFMTVDGAKKMPRVETLSSNTEAKYFTISEPESPGISDRDSIMSENLITKTDFGVAHASTGTKKGADTKISLGISDSDSQMSESLITKTDFGVAHSSIGTKKGVDTKISLGISDSDSQMSESLITETDFGVAHSSIGTKKGADTKIPLGISDRDSQMSESLITKTDFGVAHSSIETRKGVDTKIPLGISDSDSQMSENLITKTDFGVAHSSIGTRKGLDTKIPLGISDSDSQMSESLITKTDFGVAHSSIETRKGVDTKIPLGISDSDSQMSESLITETDFGVAHSGIETRKGVDTKIPLGISDSDSQMSESLITKTDFGVAHSSIETRKGVDTKIPLGISDSDSKMSESLITKTDFGVAHSGIETRKGVDTKISLGISDSDSKMSENFITKTNVGVAHSSIGTRNGSDTKISHDILTQKSDTELAFFNTKSTDVDITPVYDDVLNTQPKVTPANMSEVYDDILNTQPKVTPANMNEVYDDILNNQPKVTPANMNEVYDDILNTQPTITPDNTNKVYDDVLDIKDEKIHDVSDWTKIGSEPLYASIRSVQDKKPAYTAIDSLNTAPEETYSYITEHDYEDVERMKASREMKIDKNEGFPNRKEESSGDNETDSDTEYEYIITHKTTKNEKELSRNDLTLTPGNNKLKETRQHQEDIIEKLKLEIKNIEILLSEEKEKNAIQRAECETLQNMYEATQQQKSVRTSETQTVDMNDKNQNNFELLEEIESPTKGNDLKEEEEIVVTTDSWKENQLLINNQNQGQDSETQADFVTDDKVNDLLAKNECLHFQIEQLSFQLSKVYNRFMRKDSDESIDSGQDSQLSPIQQQNDLLTLELEQLKQDYLLLQKEHQDLVNAGDILQEDYEKLLEERDKMQEVLEKVTNTKWVAQNEIAALETKNVIQEIPETINPNFENWEQGKQNIINKHSDTDLRTSQQRNPETEDVIEEDGLKRSIQLNSCSEVLQDQSIILNHLQTLRDENKKLFLEKENVIEDLEISFNENSELKQKLNAAIENYSLLEKNYTSLLLEKQNVAAKDISGLDSKNINDSSIRLHSNQQEQLQLYPSQPNERSIQTTDDNNIQQTLPNNSSEKEQIDIQKSNQIELLKVLISQLQQELIDSEKRYQETVQTYRLHLISAIQGHIDPDVKNGLFSIIEMRSLEGHC